MGGVRQIKNKNAAGDFVVLAGNENLTIVGSQEIVNNPAGVLRQGVDAINLGQKGENACDVVWRGQGDFHSFIVLNRSYDAII